MASENSQNRQPWQVAFGEAPLKGSKAMPQLLDFSLQNPVLINLQFEQQSEKLEFVQALFIDNSLNANSIAATMGGTNQKIIVPGGWQAYIPVLATASNCSISFTTTGTPLVPVQYLNFPVPLALWPSSGTVVTSAVGTVGSDFSANPPALLGNLIATLPVNASRNYFEVENQDTGNIQVVMDDGAGGNQTITIIGGAAASNSQGGSYSNSVERGRVRIYATAANKQVSVRQN
jgi:hypothetical protein